MFWFFFFFKQKTAYELRISDWSSDVCSSDLSDRINSCVRCGKTAPEPARALCSDSWYRTTWSFHMRRQASRWARVPAPCETAYQAPRPRQRAGQNGQARPPIESSITGYGHTRQNRLPDQLGGLTWLASANHLPLAHDRWHPPHATNRS